MKHVAIIGYGAIASHVIRAISSSSAIRLGGVIGRAERLAAAREAVGQDVAVVESIDGLATRPDLVLDCAGHPGLIAHGAGILERGIDLVSVSAGHWPTRHFTRRSRAQLPLPERAFASPPGPSAGSTCSRRRGAAGSTG